MDGGPDNVSRGGPSGCGRVLAGCGLSALVFFLLCVGAVIFGPQKEKASDLPENRGLRKCVRNMRQLSLAFQLYREDYDDRLPPAANWMDRLIIYHKDESNYRCPFDGSTRTSGGYGYALSNKVAGRTGSELGDLASRTLIYDSTNLARDASDPVTSLPNPPRHEGWNNIGYADGRVRSQKRVSDTPAPAHGGNPR
jgi:prepilin-type processing-associated H-X9-DG protein